MPKARLVFNGDNVYIEKDARIYGLKDDIASKIDGIPGVIDSLDSTSPDDALSANMGRVLQDQINAMSGIGNFLSTWDCTTGLPGTNPQVDPYTYKVGDYYVVSVVGATNYKPHGGTFTQGVPSATVETENVGINDKYYFDGADWVRIPNTAAQITIDTALSTTSTNAVENRAIANAVNAKQDIISDLNTIRSGATAGSTALQPNDNISELTNNVGYQTAGDVASAIAGKQDVLSAGDGISISSNTVTNTKPGPTISGTAPSNPTEGMLWYDSTNDVLKVYNGTNRETVDTDTNTIYTAGEGIEIKNGPDYSAMRGPCPNGFHIPTAGEFSSLHSAGQTMGAWGPMGIQPVDITQLITRLKLPQTGSISYDGSMATGLGLYYTCSTTTNPDRPTSYSFGYDYVNLVNSENGHGHSIRPFKDVSVTPDNTWTTIFDGSSTAAGAGIFWSTARGLISVSADGENWITIADKNCGATVVYNYGDTINETNGGKLYQRGNNYGFPYTGPVATSSALVDVSSYGPSEYSSNVFITQPTWWTSSKKDLWGAETGVVQRNNAITNMGVLSINGQDGHITIEKCNTKAFYLSSTTDLTTAQQVYNRYVLGKEPILIYNAKRYLIVNTYFDLDGQRFNIGFVGINSKISIESSSSFYKDDTLIIRLDTSTRAVTDVVLDMQMHDTTFSSTFLSTMVDYSTPYTPLYNGSPATKKYVDDSISHNVHFGSSAPSNPVRGMFWYDNVNSALSVYDGNAWCVI